MGTNNYVHLCNFRKKRFISDFLMPDQEMVSNPTPKNGNSASNLVSACCFPRRLDPNPARAVLAEMVGTFLLMICVCGIAAGAQLTRAQLGLLDYAAAAGLTVVVLTFSIGPISGAHFNPAITVASATSGYFPWSRVLPYTAAQTTGSVVATYAVMLVYGVEPDRLTTRPLHGGVSAFWVEVLATFIIMFIAASLAYEAQSVGRLSGFVIGMAIGLAVFIAGPVSGGSMNPARSLGPAIVSWTFNDIWIYVSAPVIGAVSGALLSAILRPPVLPPPLPEVDYFIAPPTSMHV